MTNSAIPALTLSNLSVHYDKFSLQNISLEVAQGEYFVILGLSGAGKTLILEAIAGMIAIDEGTILLNGREITNSPIGARKVGMLFQDYAIFPHMTVFHNIAFPLKSAGIRGKRMIEKVKSLAREAGIAPLLSRWPGTLSGGELQRVALCRILAHDPDVLLLDEPMSALDVALRDDFQELLRHINRSGKTILHITHDFNEAISLAHRVAVVEHGSLVQMGTPEEVFRNPSNDFVARLSGVKNFFPAVHHGEHKALHNCGFIFMLAENYPVGYGFVMIGSSEIVLSEMPVESSMTNMIQGTVIGFHYTPNGYEVKVDAGVVLTAVITEGSFRKLNILPGKKIWASFKASAVRFVSADWHKNI